MKLKPYDLKSQRLVEYHGDEWVYVPITKERLEEVIMRSTKTGFTAWWYRCYIFDQYAGHFWDK